MTQVLTAAKLEQFSAGSDPVAIGEALLETGAVIVRDVLSPATLQAFNGEIDAEFAAAADAERKYLNATLDAFYGPQTRHVAGLAGKSAVFRRDILCGEIFVAMCDRVLQPNCVTCQLNFADVIDRGPGAPDQVMHRDDGVWFHLPRQSFPLEFASMTALGPFTADMGATRIVPGSHRWEPSRAPAEDEIVVAELEPCSSVFYLGSVLHAGGANRTQARRRGMHLSYCLGWLRSQDNNYLTVPLDLVRSLPREQQAMLGYALHDAIPLGGGFLGSVDWRDPLDLIAEGAL